jgi:dolichol kinase
MSHLFLLLGCWVPTISSYILIDGKNFPPHFIYFSLSGFIFVGLGDAMAALGGRTYGKTMWKDRKKSQEGSFIWITFYLFLYLTTLSITQPSVVSGKAIEVFLAGFVATMVEAFTRQFDNFLWPQIWFASILFLNYYFEVFIEYHQ